MGVSVWQLLLVLALFLLFFGRGRIPALMTDLAAGIKSFRNTLQDGDSKPPEVTSESPESPPKTT